MQRRDLLHAFLAACAYSFSPRLLAARPVAPELTSGAFSYAALKGHARALAARDYEPPAKLAPKPLIDLTYDRYQAIRFRRDRALWRELDSAFRVELFHLGRGFKEPVQLYELVDGQPRPIDYHPELFDLSKSGLDARKLGTHLGFAGFRVHTSTNWAKDLAVFLGASYFRGMGSESTQLGLSARGLAIDTGYEVEEFPRFESFWLERPAPGSRTLVLYALLDSPSAAGAYRFALTPGARLLMDVDAAIYPRTTIRRLGIAPLTSMFHCGENDRRMAYDWRPEIHDSDGLQMLTGQGEWIWRPLTNPPSMRISSYLDENPRGFGLLQRDRAFEHYQDDGVFYEQRPSLWIEPKHGWGKGAVQLVELTAPDETFDNIVAYWLPEQAPKRGEELLYGYRMYWGTEPPIAPQLAHTVATRTGLGGIVGQRRKYFSWRFAVDFVGGELASLAERAEVEPVISLSRGRFEIASARPLKPLGGYRAMFDIVPPDDSVEPIDIRLYLRHRGQPLTETWMYQWTPPTPQERRAALDAASS